MTIPTGDAGIPGARCVGKLAVVKKALLDREQAYERRLEAHAVNMEKAADHYKSQEDAATRDLSIPVQSAGGRRAI